MRKPRRAGDLDEKFSIWRPKLTINAETGSKEFSPEVVVQSAWGSVKFIGTPSAGASEDKINDQRTGKVKIEVVMRYVNGVKFEDFVVYQGGHFEIYSIQRSDRNSFLVLRAEMRDDYTWSIGNTEAGFNDGLSSQYYLPTSDLPLHPADSDDDIHDQYWKPYNFSEGWIIFKEDGSISEGDTVLGERNAFYLTTDWYDNAFASGTLVEAVHPDTAPDCATEEVIFDYPKNDPISGLNQLLSADPAGSLFQVEVYLPTKYRGIGTNEYHGTNDNSSTMFQQFGFFNAVAPDGRLTLGLFMEPRFYNNAYIDVPIAYYGHTTARAFASFIYQYLDSNNEVVNGNITFKPHFKVRRESAVPRIINYKKLSWFVKESSDQQKKYDAQNWRLTGSLHAEENGKYKYAISSLADKAGQETYSSFALAFNTKYPLNAYSQIDVYTAPYRESQNADLDFFVYEAQYGFYSSELRWNPGQNAESKANIATEDLNICVKKIELWNPFDSEMPTIDLTPYITSINPKDGSCTWEYDSSLTDYFLNDLYRLKVTFSSDLAYSYNPSDVVIVSQHQRMQSEPSDVPFTLQEYEDYLTQQQYLAENDGVLPEGEELIELDFSGIITNEPAFIRASAVLTATANATNSFDTAVQVCRAGDAFPREFVTYLRT